MLADFPGSCSPPPAGWSYPSASLIIHHRPEDRARSGNVTGSPASIFHLIQSGHRGVHRRGPLSTDGSARTSTSTSAGRRPVQPPRPLPPAGDGHLTGIATVARYI